MKTIALRWTAVLCLMAGFFDAPPVTRAAPVLGEPSLAPSNYPVSQNANGPHALFVPVTGGFSVNTSQREQTRDFFNAIYPASENVPENSTADQANCYAGHNSPAFMDAELLRINWFRAMAGMPGTVTLDAVDNGNAQQMAVMISQNGLNHVPPPSDTCYTAAGASVAGGNQGGGFNGADCITGYIQEFGGTNSDVGHRRWILFPPEIIMGIGDVPQEGSLPPANLTWVFDPRGAPTRPATRNPFVAWPPAGYVPYQVAFPYWSFGYPNANFSNSVVTMKSNGVPVSVGSYNDIDGYGDNTLCWVPMGVDTMCECTLFPYSGTDTVYSVTVSNVNVGGSNLTFSYNVTLFNPAQPGADYAPVTMNGPSQALVNQSTTYSCTPPNDPNVTSYNFLSAELVASNVFEDANADEDNGGNLVNFTFSPPPQAPLITDAPDGSTNECFHLCHAGSDSAPQILQLTDPLYPSSNTVLTFEGVLGVATTNEIARVQVSTDGGATWNDIFTEPGGNASANFTFYTLSLSNYAGEATLLRFNYDFTGGEYYSDGYNWEGWCLENIGITNSQLMLGLATNIPATTNIVSGNLFDDASNGLANFSQLPAAIYYYAATNAPDGSGPCFHLCHFEPASQFLQLNELLIPSASASVSFDSLLGYATSDETARVQVSTDYGTNWADLYVEAGTGGSGESSFSPHSVSLSAYAGQPTLLRFNFAFTGGSYYGGTDNYIGWDIEDILITNCQQRVTNLIDTTNFTITPVAVGAYLLQAQPVICGQFPLGFGPVKTINIVSNLAASILMSQPIVNSGQVVLNFTASGLTTSTFHLLQASPINGGWTTNTSATLVTNSTSSYRFTATPGPASCFYRVKSP